VQVVNPRLESQPFVSEVRRATSCVFPDRDRLPSGRGDNQLHQQALTSVGDYTRRFLREAHGSAGAQAPLLGVPGIAWHFTVPAAAPTHYRRGPRCSLRYYGRYRWMVMSPRCSNCARHSSSTPRLSASFCDASAGAAVSSVRC